MNGFSAWLRASWSVGLLAAAVALLGLVFIDSATAEGADTATQLYKQTVFLCAGAGLALVLVATPYPRVLCYAWLFYFAALMTLAALPMFGVVINGAQRWFKLPGRFLLQPSEFTKLALIIALASWLRFRHKARTFDGLVVPLLITAVPAALVLRQPDLGSSMVFWPVLLAMCFVAGAPARSLVALLVIGVVVMVLGFFVLHEYQRVRIETWWEHFWWQPEVDPGEDPVLLERAARMREMLRSHAYQP